MTYAWSQRRVREGVVLFLGETALVVGAVMGSAYVRLGPAIEIASGGYRLLVLRAVVVAAVWQLCLYYGDLYVRRTALDRRLLVIRIAQSLAGAWIALAVIYFWLPFLAVGRGLFFMVVCVLPLIALALRLVPDWRHGSVRVRERLFIEGCSPATLALARELHHRRHELAVEIVGFVDRDPARVGTRLFNPSIIGTVADLPALVATHSADRVAVSTIAALDDMPLDRLLRLRMQGVAFDHLAGVYEEYTGKLAIDTLTPAALMFTAGFKSRPRLRAAKRACDLVAALIGLVAGAPVMMLVAAAIKLTSPGPVLYRQTRVGRNGRLFTLYKFRSMQRDAEDGTGPVWARVGDPRVTWVGRPLRLTRLDELPQLWNVLRGDMSLVGPRPERPELEGRLSEEIPFYRQRYLVKPGLTGWAQVRHAYSGSLDEARVKLQYDLFYIKNMSLAFDFLILFMTTKAVIRCRGAR